MASENRNVRGSRDGSGRGDYGNRDRANNRDQDSRDGSSRQTTRRRKGKCKWFNVVKGWGFITPDDGGQEVFVHQHVIHMEGFRSLAENENVEFECEETAKGFEATVVTGPSGTQCVGSQRAITRKRSRKIRCYNCGEYGNHIAAKCKMGPMPKRCHHCKSEDHLIADCPQRFNKNSVPVSHDENGEEDEMDQQLKSRMANLSVADKK